MCDFHSLKLIQGLLFAGYLLFGSQSFSQEKGCVKGDCKSGPGTYVFSSGDKYEGEFKEGNFNGFGTFYFSSGHIYTGDFVNGKRTGKGKMVYPDKSIYNGEFQNDMFEGYGEFQSGRKYKYAGQYLEDLYHGKGELWDSTGIHYSGDFSFGKKEGKGKITYLDKSSYEGDFMNDIKHGNGVLSYSDGSIYKGEFAEDKRSGSGNFQLIKGGNYKGEWWNDMFDGKGVFYNSDEDSISGFWKQGQQVLGDDIKEKNQFCLELNKVILALESDFKEAGGKQGDIVNSPWKMPEFKDQLIIRDNQGESFYYGETTHKVKSELHASKIKLSKEILGCRRCCYLSEYNHKEAGVDQSIFTVYHSNCPEEIQGTVISVTLIYDQNQSKDKLTLTIGKEMRE